ncbi:thyroid adenoma-associated protein [Canna indica]|uniref:Thyroid adenoma-associated protein n=1 Tax=Canna indica TaxID=4628 RepID=A0AAQ3Q9F3_9LILI|nr:thyroid adenoma-associated protein [Canna indica]
MSAKWRALQNRHRYTYSSVVFPKHFLEALNLAPLDALSSSDFFSQLNHLVSLSSTYSQLVSVKDLASAFARLLASPGIADSTVSTATRLYLEILFLENSLPLHRTLISALVKSQKFASIIGACLLSLCEEYGKLDKKGKKRFLVSRAVLSLMSYPKLGFLNDIVEVCSGLVAMDVIAGLESVVLDVEHGFRPSPVVMEQCQEAMSCLYYLLQRHPAKFAGSEEASVIFESVIGTILSILKSSAFSRDCLVAAGVSFCAAIQVFMSAREISLFISRGFFGLVTDSTDIRNAEITKVLHDEDWYSIIKEFSVLSRLCLLRGILTAVPRTVLNMHLTESTNGPVWTILYSGILPELCKYCESPIDSHFNFHALTVTQICLQQIKTSILANLTDFSSDYKPLSYDTINRILRIIWNNLEDPLSQTVKQVHLIFDLLLDIVSSLPSGEGNDRSNLLLHRVAGDLLHLGPRCKGRYVPLAALTKRLGAKALLDLNPNLLFETIYAYIEDDVCCAATSFLKCFLECLRDECWNHDGIEKGYNVFRDLCIPPILRGLVSGYAKLRSNLNTYALPAVLEVDMDSIFPMLAFISVGPNMRESTTLDLEIEQCVAALVSLLKVSRTLALTEGDIDLIPDSVLNGPSDHIAVVCIKGINVKVPAVWFTLALKHADDSLRMDAAESLFLNPKTSSLPSAFELSLMRVAVPLNMRCSSTAFQMKWASLFRKFFTRVRTALERQVKQGIWQPDACFNGNGIVAHDSTRDLVVCRAEDLFRFMKWLSCFLFHSCYPSAPYERKTMAMELILVMIDAWPIVMPQGTSHLYPYNEAITSPDATVSLVGSIIDSWDKLRESSFRILLCFPTPLPGISSIDSVNVLIRWAKKLVCSPRVRESDAGALTFRLIYKKYVLGLGWELGVSEKANCFTSQSKTINVDLNVKFNNPVIQYLSSLVEWLCVVVEEGEKDLSEACRKSFVHGVLLTLRYTFEELDWSSPVVQSSISEIRCLLDKLLDLIMRITSLALWVVSADAWSMPYDIDDIIENSAFLSDLSLDVDPSEPALDPGNKKLASEDIVRPAEQVVMVGCWLAMKEVSLLLGTIIRKIPLPSCTVSYSSEQGHAFEGSDDNEMTDGVLDLVQLETIGNHFLQVLLKMKHNGAIDKTRAGFTALCNRLLCSNDSRLNKMTESWMEQLMERTTTKGQTVDDLLRRSAGIPAAFIAFFLSEPEGTPKKLLPRALQWLIGVANKSLSNNTEVGFSQTDVLAEEEPLRSLIPDSGLEGLTTLPASTRNSKIRDEGVIPTVHAFNVLRAAFNDTNLAVDTSGFCAEAMIISIRSFSSPYWEVRNSACLAYTTLVRRMLGFFNIQKRESSRKALTGLEFFHRYPALHAFLLSELKIATELLGDGCSKNMETNIAKAIHPSLCPILILLSRLKPSIISSGIGDALDPSLFMPYIQKCATQSNLRVRVLASRALTGLVSNEKLQTVICSVARCLPHSRSHMSLSMTVSLDLSGSPRMHNGLGSVTTCATSFNSIHGFLLQLSSLLDNNCRDLTDISTKEQILGELIQALSKCYWIGSIQSCPCPTLNCSYMRVLDLMLDIARTTSTSEHTTSIRSLLLKLALGFVDVDQWSSWLTWYDPTVIDLRKQATASYFSCLFGKTDLVLEDHIQVPVPLPTSNIQKVIETEISVSEIHQKIMSCVLDPTYEVRLAALKKVLQLVNSLTRSVKSGVIYVWAKSNLHSMLIKLFSVEENPKCIYYILKIFFSWNLIQPEKPTDLQCSIAADRDFHFCFWDWLINLYRTVKRTKTREITLSCMGICAKQFVSFLKSSFFTDQYQTMEEMDTVSSDINQSEKWAKAFSNIDSFVSLVNRHSAPSEPVNMRKAAAEAIVASGMLAEAKEVASVVSNRHVTFEDTWNINIGDKISRSQMSEVVNLYACKVLDLWFTCVQLLEDEDNGLRQKLAKDVQNCISSKIINIGSYPEAVPTQVDRLLEASFDFLSSIFGDWLEYLKYLAKLVLRTASSVSSHGDLVRRIFDKEIDNHHEEKLLICQFCCSHLGNLLVPKSCEFQVHPQGLDESCVQKFSSIWRLRFLQQLISFANSCLETEGITDWIGGIGNHKDAFVSLYTNLLGIYALSQQPYNDEFYLSKFSELEGIIRPFLRNPLISNLYSLVLQSHERRHVTCGTQPQKGIPLDDGFDPYFLLR